MKSPSTITWSVKYGLHFIGIWPGTPFPGLHKFYWITSMVIIQSYQYRYIVQHIRSNSLTETIDNVCISMAFSHTCIKLIIAWINHGVLCDILASMEEDCKKCAAIDTNNLISKKINFSNRITTIIMFLYIMSAVCHCTGSTATPYLNESYPLPLKMDLPFDVNKSPNYQLVLTAQVLHQASTAFSFGVFSALLLMVVFHVGYQVDIMCQAITDVPVIGKEQLKLFIKRHHRIIEFTEKIEKFFSPMALSQIVSNTLNNCCLGFLLVISISSDAGLPLLIKSLLFYIVIWIDAFGYCYAGEYLSTKSKMICETMYKCLWYNLHPSESQLLIIVLLRSQKGFTFTFGKFSNLSLESFTTILKASASYMSVLLAMS